MKKLKHIPLYTFLLAVFFNLHGASENFGFVNFADASKLCLGILIFTSCLFTIVYLFNRKILYAGVVTFFICTWYLFFGAIKDSLSIFPLIDHYIVLLPILLLLTILLIIFFAKKKQLLPGITFYLNILLIVYCAYDAISLMRKAGTNHKSVFAITPLLNEKKNTQKPNVYYLLFDEYAGYKSLEDSFHFKNDLFYGQLKNAGFTFLNTFSNYHYTSFSMSSILNMNYIPVLTEPGKVTWQDVEKRKSEIKNAAVFQNFKKAGYTVKAFSVFDVGDIKMTGGNTFMKGHEYILTEKILHNRIFKIFGWSFPEAIKRMPFMHEFDPDDLVNYNEKVTRSVLKSVAEKSRVTQFVYAHFLLPHHPYLFDSTGSPVTFNATTMNRKETYLSYLKYANNKITDLLSKLIKADPGAIIIVMSDHGYRDLVYTLGPKPFYFDNICAVRNISIPASSTISISNVNFFRYFFNTYFGQQFSYLPDSTIALSDKYHKTGDY